jgi:DNA-binding transcriptional MerR regulator
MRDLVRLSGTPAPTIHFYTQQGLLPRPRKTASNQALYRAGTVERILWIRSLQAELHLPLRTIRWVLGRWGQLPLDEIRSLQALGSLLEEPDPAASADELARVRERLGPHDLEALQGLELIGDPDHPTTSEMRVLELVAAMRAAGFTERAGFNIDNLALYRDAVERLVQDEAVRIIEPVLGRHEPETLRDLIRVGLPLANELFVLLHQRALQRDITRAIEGRSATDEPAMTTDEPAMTGEQEPVPV